MLDFRKMKASITQPIAKSANDEPRILRDRALFPLFLQKQRRRNGAHKNAYRASILVIPAKAETTR
jgi:hypothetical protein